jgi:hypothetical protein
LRSAGIFDACNISARVIRTVFLANIVGAGCVQLCHHNAYGVPDYLPGLAEGRTRWLRARPTSRVILSFLRRLAFGPLQRVRGLAGRAPSQA